MKVLCSSFASTQRADLSFLSPSRVHVLLKSSTHTHRNNYYHIGRAPSSSLYLLCSTVSHSKFYRQTFAFRAAERKLCLGGIFKLHNAFQKFFLSRFTECETQSDIKFTPRQTPPGWIIFLRAKLIWSVTSDDRAVGWWSGRGFQNGFIELKFKTKQPAQRSLEPLNDSLRKIAVRERDFSPFSLRFALLSQCRRKERENAGKGKL